MQKKTSVAALLALLLVIALLSSLLLISLESGHICTGENCQICCHIHDCKNLFENFRSATVRTTLVIALLLAIWESLTSLYGSTLSVTLVALKVKLSN